MRETITVTAEDWDRLARTCNLVRLIEQESRMKDGEERPLSVLATSYGSHLYTSFSVGFGGFRIKNPACVNMYRLVPENAFSGETTLKYHDEKAIKEGKRARGDMTGLIVTYNRRRYVCGTRCDAFLTFPAQRITVTEAKRLEESLFSCISLGHARMEARREDGVSWHTYDGHPVACYGSIRTLFWRSEKGIRMDHLDDGYQLSPADLDDAPLPAQSNTAALHSTPSPLQLNLF